MVLRPWNGPTSGGIAVLGGGLSGLSLVAHLAAADARPGPIVLLDDGRNDIARAAWASWTRRPGLLDPAASESFARIRVRAGGRDRELSLDEYRYRVVHGAHLLAEVRRHTDPVADVGSVTGHVTEIVESGSGPCVLLGDGRELRPHWVFDARGPASSTAGADAALDFLGFRVRSRSPVFDPHVPVLFDFRTEQTAASFLYVLPTDAQHALVEHTCFTDATGPAIEFAAHRDAVCTYLTDVLGLDGGSVDAEPAEGGRLPLTTHPPDRVQGRVVRVGAAAGLLEASSGYAYERIQRDSEAIARSFALHGHPCDLPKRAARFTRYNRALLRVIVEHPNFLEEMFAKLFARDSAAPVLRFLDEDSSVRDEATLFASLPAGPLIRAMAHR
ncbi:lycopene cyclase family protein [Rhodococcus sp. CH91]|uniref:lycopene cyclase family protein n=1 Tax=Rhodococcus sp. CH91 TaxID=2910256 RepID=UPI001F4A7AAF|nr:lycopene cyclase family protein [Rhodococcus sp. CH91]